MTMNYFKTLETILRAPKPLQKIEMFHDFYEKYKKGDISFEECSPALEFDKPSYFPFCSSVPPQDVPKRKNLTAADGQINLIHAVAHIEYSAID